jgi:hypothetical protein
VFTNIQCKCGYCDFTMPSLFGLFFGRTEDIVIDSVAGQTQLSRLKKLDLWKQCELVDNLEI